MTEASFEKALSEAGGIVTDALEALKTKRTQNIDRLKILCDQMALLQNHANARSGEDCAGCSTTS